MIIARLAGTASFRPARRMNTSIAMKAELSQILKEYTAFETEVRCRISERCAPYCSVCEHVCCRPEYCRENIDSPFLTQVSSQTRRSFCSGETLPNTAGCARAGWLTSTGCALSTGRPPVCYQFSCKKITGSLPDDQQRYLFRVLSELVPHIGKRAFGGRHLVEIMDAATLERININRFRRQLAEARKALDAIRSFSANRSLPASALKDLARIKPRIKPPTHAQCRK